MTTVNHGGKDWMLAQEAQEVESRHGQAQVPADLRHGFSMTRWPGDAVMRRMYNVSVDKAVGDLAWHHAKHSSAEDALRRGAEVDPTKRSPGATDMLRFETKIAYHGLINEIDDGPDPSTIRLH